jgi:hypothetical protein
MTTLQTGNRLGTLGTSASPFPRPIRDARIVAGLGRAAWFFLVQGIRPREFAGWFRFFGR